MTVYAAYQGRLAVVSERERDAAKVGGLTWRQFLVWAEEFLGLPWDQIRSDLNTLHEREAQHASSSLSMRERKGDASKT